MLSSIMFALLYIQKDHRPFGTDGLSVQGEKEGKWEKIKWISDTVPNAV